MGCIFRIYGEKKPLNRLSPILVKDIHDVITHAKFVDDRLRGSGVVSGHSISHWLCWSSLQHSHTTVCSCDILMFLYVDFFLCIGGFGTSGVGRDSSSLWTESAWCVSIHIWMSSDGEMLYVMELCSHCLSNIWNIPCKLFDCPQQPGFQICFTSLSRKITTSVYPDHVK